jgi:response regulator RpfG family c-di-GMP phosphodiesterase
VAGLDVTIKEYEFGIDVTKNIPIMFLLGKTDTVDKEKAMALGAVYFIAKPINVPDIQKRVKSTFCKNIK